jgi:hypothetical protein
MYDCTQTCADTCLYLQRNALRDTVICPTAAAQRRARLRQITLLCLTCSISASGWPWLRSLGSLNCARLVGPQRWIVGWSLLPCPSFLHESRRRIQTGSRQIAYDADWPGRIVCPWQAKRQAGKQAKRAKKALGRRRIWPGAASG